MKKIVFLLALAVGTIVSAHAQMTLTVIPAASKDSMEKITGVDASHHLSYFAKEMDKGNNPQYFALIRAENFDLNTLKLYGGTADAPLSELTGTVFTFQDGDLVASTRSLGTIFFAKGRSFWEWRKTDGRVATIEKIDH